jgi:hypothetical protein
MDRLLIESTALPGAALEPVSGGIFPENHVADYPLRHRGGMAAIVFS